MRTGPKAPSESTVSTADIWAISKLAAWPYAGGSHVSWTSRAKTG
jgi:hypothetical protein